MNRFASVREKTGTALECPECGTEDYVYVATKGRYTRLCCETCGCIYVVDTDDMPPEDLIAY